MENGILNISWKVDAIQMTRNGEDRTGMGPREN